MWLTKFILRRRLAAILKRHSQLSPLQPNRRACLEMVAELNPNLFMSYHPLHGNVSVEFFYPSIEQYTNKIKEINQTLRGGRPISPEWLDGIKPQHATIDSFFRTADGHYAHPPMAVATFKLVCLQLCSLMEKSDTETSGLHEHNLRMLTKLFINLRIVSQRLVEVSLTKA